MLIPLGILATAGAGGAGAATFQLLESQILSSNQTAVTFSNLNSYAANYRHLQVRVVGRSATGSTFDALRFRFNGDTGANYARHALWGTGSNVDWASASSETRGYIGYLDGNTATGNSYAATIIDILEPFSTTKTKTLRGRGGIQNQTSSFTAHFGSLWNSTSAVTSLVFDSDSTSNILAGSRFSLYGIKA
jgi:hypothetical protein